MSEQQNIRDIESKVVRARELALDALEPGMKCAEDVRSSKGAVLLPAGGKIEEKHIRFLKAAGITKVSVVAHRKEYSPEVNEALIGTPRVEAESEVRILKATRALVVDDMRLMRAKITTILREMGIEKITEARDGKECIDIIGRGGIDLVTLDVEMPVMDGIKAVGIITERYPKVKVMMVSSIGEEDRVVQCMALGAIDFVTKPLNDARVRRSVMNVISHYKVETVPIDQLKEGSRFAADITAQAEAVLVAKTPPSN